MILVNCFIHKCSFSRSGFNSFSTFIFPIDPAVSTFIFPDPLLAHQPSVHDGLRLEPYTTRLMEVSEILPDHHGSKIEFYAFLTQRVLNERIMQKFCLPFSLYVSSQGLVIWLSQNLVQNFEKNSFWILQFSGVCRGENYCMASNVSEELVAFFFRVVLLDYIEDGRSNILPNTDIYTSRPNNLHEAVSHKFKSSPALFSEPLISDLNFRNHAPSAHINLQCNA
jgi:hypothetical protein